DFSSARLDEFSFTMRAIIPAFVAPTFKLWPAFTSLGISLLPLVAIRTRLYAPSFLFARWFCLSAVALFQFAQQCRYNASGVEPFFEQTFDEMILSFEVAALKRGANSFQENICTRFLHFAGRWNFSAMNLCFRKAFDGVDLKQFAPGHK